MLGATFGDIVGSKFEFINIWKIVRQWLPREGALQYLRQWKISTVGQ